MLPITPSRPAEGISALSSAPAAAGGLGKLLSAQAVGGVLDVVQQGRMDSGSGQSRPALAAGAAGSDNQGTPSASTRLSDTARLLSSLLGSLPTPSADEAPGYGAQLKLASAGLLPHPPGAADTPALAQALASSIQASGLSYEASLARWQASPSPESLRLVLQQPQNTERSTGLPDPSLTAQQLSFLETGRVQVQAQAWPGQPLLMDIALPTPPLLHRHAEDDRPEGNANSPGAAEGGKPWTTRLRLHVPGLGEVEVQLEGQPAEGGHRLRVKVIADAEGAGQLQAHQQELVLALEAAGLQPDGIGIFRRAVP